MYSLYKHDGKSGLPITDGGLGQAGGVSGYSMIREKSAGLMVADPTRMGSILMQRVEDESVGTTPTAQLWWTW